MKKQLLTLIALTILFIGCKKKDDTVAIDMTVMSYSADAKYNTFPVVLQLDFKSDGTVQLWALPFNQFVILKYEVADKMASNTTLHIYGELDKDLNANGFTKGTKIEWTTNIGRLSYKPEIIGFKAGEYHFASY